jgi:arylsulfatase A-like enzyme
MVSLTGRERSADIPEDSRDQLAAWLGIDPEGRDYVIGAASTLTVLTRDWKYIEPGKGQPYNKLTNTEMGNREADQLYDMRSDRGEYDNMAAKNKLMLRFMKQILEEEKSKGIRQDL